MSDIAVASIFAFLFGLVVGWCRWGFPYAIAEQRGKELEEDGYTMKVVKKDQP